MIPRGFKKLTLSRGKVSKDGTDAVFNLLKTRMETILELAKTFQAERGAKTLNQLDIYKALSILGIYLL